MQFRQRTIRSAVETRLGPIKPGNTNNSQVQGIKEATAIRRTRRCWLRIPLICIDLMTVPDFFQSQNKMKFLAPGQTKMRKVSKECSVVNPHCVLTGRAENCCSQLKMFVLHERSFWSWTASNYLVWWVRPRCGLRYEQTNVAGFLVRCAFNCFCKTYIFFLCPSNNIFFGGGRIFPMLICSHKANIKRLTVDVNAIFLWRARLGWGFYCILTLVRWGHGKIF